MKKIYLDNAATTRVDPQVVESMIPYLTELYGNASSLHSFGVDAYEALEKSRLIVADSIGARSKEIIFTSGGTESDNLAITGVAHLNKGRGKHIITTSIEHPAVLETCKHLMMGGYRISFLPVDRYGIVDMETLKSSITNDTILISVMHANNEIGTIEPIRQIGEIAHENEIPFHTDAVQTMGKLKIDVQKLNVDLLSLSAHKIYGPKGVGALYIREGVEVEPLIQGGGHERGRRSSTENIPGIIGLAKALELAKSRFNVDIPMIQSLRDMLIKGVTDSIVDSYLTGHVTSRLPNNAHFYFPGIEGEALILGLDEKGVAASTGSACSSKKSEPSHVLKAIGLDDIEARGSLRLTLSRFNDKTEIGYLIKILPEIVGNLRDISPIWKEKVMR